MTLDLSTKRWGVVVTHFNFDQSEASPDQPWTSGSQDSKSQHELGASPRLVGGTTFANKAPLDKVQVKLLTFAAIESMEETRKILTKWRRQGQSLADIYLYGITDSAKLIGELLRRRGVITGDDVEVRNLVATQLGEHLPRFRAHGCMDL